MTIGDRVEVTERVGDLLGLRGTLTDSDMCTDNVLEWTISFDDGQEEWLRADEFRVLTVVDMLAELDR